MVSFQSFGHEFSSGDEDHGPVVDLACFVFLVQASAVGEPSKGALDDPAFGLQGEALTPALARTTSTRKPCRGNHARHLAGMLGPPQVRSAQK